MTEIPAEPLSAPTLPLAANAPFPGRAVTTSIALSGLTGNVVHIEATVTKTPGETAFRFNGLDEISTRLTRDSVVSAITATDGANVSLTDLSISVSFNPYTSPKYDRSFDLAIAMAVLAAMGLTGPEHYGHSIAYFGRLTDSGWLSAIPGVLPAVQAASRAGIRRVVVAPQNVLEAQLVAGAQVTTRDALAGFLRVAQADSESAEKASSANSAPAAAASPTDRPGSSNDPSVQTAIDAIMVAAAGGHNIFVDGPMGPGKAQLARVLGALLPDLDDEAALEVTAIRSLLGQVPDGRLVRRPPMAAPHHSVSLAAMTAGGARRVTPGYAALANKGVLLLENAPEFSSVILDALRFSLECGVVRTQTNSSSPGTEFPARFQLAMAADSCPCGKFGGEESERCTCTEAIRRRYLNRLAGPLMDRCDLRVALSSPVLIPSTGIESIIATPAARERVVAARERARVRFGSTPWKLNAEATSRWLHGDRLRLSRKVTVKLDEALGRGAITQRGYDRVLRVALTIADLNRLAQPDKDCVKRAMVLSGVARI